MLFRQAEPSGVCWRHQLEGGRKAGSMGLLENSRRERMNTLNQVMFTIRARGPVIHYSDVVELHTDDAPVSCREQRDTRIRLSFY